MPDVYYGAPRFRARARPAIAVPAAGWLGRFARTQLFEIRPLDPISLVGAGVGMGLLAAIAALLPALKAARIDPVRALKTE